jgi:hypothetical protein
VPPELTEPNPKREYSPLLFLAIIAAVNIATPWLPMPNALTAIATGLVLTLIYVAAIVGLGLSVARKKLSFPTAITLFVAAAMVWLAIEYFLLPYVGSTMRALRQAQTPPSGSMRLLLATWNPIQDVAMISGAVMAGTVLARMVRHPNMLGPIGAAIALIDIWGVLFQGPVSQLLANKATQPLAQKALAAGPQLQQVQNAPAGFHVAVPSVGVGDFLFVSLLLSVVVNLGMNWKTSARLMWLLVSLALLSITFVPLFLPRADFALPGLLFIGAAVVLPNWKYFRFTREEQFALLYAGILVLILTIGIYFGLKAALPPETVKPPSMRQG